MPGPTTGFLNHETREIRDGFLKTRVGLAEVRTEVRVFSGIVGLVGTLTITGILSGIWWAATLSSRVGFQETRFDKVEARLDKVDGRLDKVEARLGTIDGRLDKIDGHLDKIDARFDRLEASIAKALAKP